MMKNINNILIDCVAEGVEKLYGVGIDKSLIQIELTHKDFSGDRTLIVFPLLRYTKKSPEETAKSLGAFIQENIDFVSDYNVIKGFLNINISDRYWISFLQKTIQDASFGTKKNEDPKHFLVEYSSPNTNKPLHLGHIRNNLLGYSISQILKANGHKVTMVNLVNDRGIHICKSMLAWKKWGNGATPTSTGKKGDHLVGDYYVLFDKEYKKELQQLISSGMTEDEASAKAPLLLEAQDMLRLWEAGDKETVALWETMNAWVYEGFEKTYRELGVHFDKIYYESQTYLLGKELTTEGLKKNILYKKEDGSVWIDLCDKGLDQKLLLRPDGTSVYMTQDMGTAKQRYDEYKPDKMIYVVGNEQDYHFKVLSIIMQQLGFAWADAIYHLSYGMVELPEGKMKSREGTVVDADNLIDEMYHTAREMSRELGKLDDYPDAEKEKICKIIGMGALKYFILKVDPKKNMTFNPKESIDFNGNTGPFIQYSYTRIRSVLSKAAAQNIHPDCNSISNHSPLVAAEKQLLKTMYIYPEILDEAANTLSPAIIANYAYELACQYNEFYQSNPILKNDNRSTMYFRILLSELTGKILQMSMQLLGIEMPERM